MIKVFITLTLLFLSNERSWLILVINARKLSIYCPYTVPSSQSIYLHHFNALFFAVTVFSVKLPGPINAIGVTVSVKLPAPINAIGIKM